MTEGETIAVALTVPVGICLGLLGAGGTILLLPILVVVAQISVPEAIGQAMVVVAVTSVVGAIVHASHGGFAYREALAFSVAGMPAAYLASHLTHLIGPRLVLGLYGGLMIASGLGTILRGRPPAQPSKADGPPNPSESVPKRNGPARDLIEPDAEAALGIKRCLAVGGATGALTGFLGVGGGFVIVPALVTLAGVEVRRAVGASLAIIGANAVAGLAGHLQEIELVPTRTAWLVVASLGGMVIGQRIALHISSRVLQRGFGAFVLALGSFLGLAASTGIGLAPFQPTHGPGEAREDPATEPRSRDPHPRTTGSAQPELGRDGL